MEANVQDFSIVHNHVHMACQVLFFDATLESRRFGRFDDFVFGDFLRNSDITQYIHITDM